MIELTEALIASLQEKARVPPAPLAGMIRAAKNDAVDFVCSSSFRMGIWTATRRGIVGEPVESHLRQPEQNPVSGRNAFHADRGRSRNATGTIPLYHLGDAVTVAMVSPNDQQVVTVLENLLMKRSARSFVSRMRSIRQSGLIINPPSMWTIW